MRGVLATFVVLAAATAAGCSDSSADPATDAGDRDALRRQTTCPTGVLGDESIRAPIADVISAAEGLLAAQTLNSQGTVYRLTPRHAPITHVQRIVATGTEADARPPGLLRIQRHAAALCGEATANASWAIRYDVFVSVIALTQGYPFLVKTTSGWRFWGQWCGAGRPAAWRAANCS